MVPFLSFHVLRSDAYDVDMKKLKMWEPLHGLLLESSTSDELKMQTLWVIGTALQNNPAAQLKVSHMSPGVRLAHFTVTDSCNLIIVS